MIIVPLADLNLDKAEKFASQVTPTTAITHANRNQFNPHKRQSDSIVGNIVEQAWKLYLTRLGFKVTDVDVKIYPPKDKSWIPDLYIIDKNAFVHCKGQTESSAKKCGESWMFQFANNRGEIGKGHTDPVTQVNETKENDWFAFGSIEGANVILRAFFPACWAHEKQLWGLPKYDHLQKSKIVIYLEDLEKYLDKDMWSIDKL